MPSIKRPLFNGVKVAQQILVLLVLVRIQVEQLAKTGLKSVFFYLISMDQVENLFFLIFKRKFYKAETNKFNFGIKRFCGSIGTPIVEVPV